jgi:hypothetical protein
MSLISRRVETANDPSLLAIASAVAVAFLERNE